MAEELGRIERLPVDSYRTGRKLFFVPLVFAPREPEGDLQELVTRYWDQVEAHLSNLEAKLGSVNKIYHELVPIGGEEGAKAIESLNPWSYRIVQPRLGRGAQLQPIEEPELLAEYTDWGKCLASGLQSQAAIAKVFELYADVQKRRNERMAEQIDKTLEDSEAGILLMREGHQVQFPASIQVFYVAPPALDEIKRWVRERESTVQNSGDS
ncbi:MAG: hypothetical protein HY675_01565 [Chloroflexi bacterium]|nr:hypothetical protein [Chloroflexota bacterium]